MTPLDYTDALRVLVVSPLLYHPGCGNGGGVLCYETLRRLGQRCEVHFVGLAPDPTQVPAGRAALEQVARSVTVVPWQYRRGLKLAGLLQQFLSLTPREVMDHDQADMHQALRDALATLRPDVVMLQFPHMAQYLATVDGVPAIMDVQDMCAVSRFREWRASKAGWAKRLLLLHTWLSWVHHEWRMYARSNRLMAISEADLGVMQAYLPDVPAFLSPVACDVAVASPRIASQDVLFVGNFTHAPNLDGLRWLLCEVWPLVYQERPAARLLLAGKGLPNDLARNLPEGVLALGFVDDLGRLMAGCAASLVPYRFGGGVKIKALESMALGCPVVATTVGAEALHARSGEHLLIGDSAPSFAGHVLSLLGSPALQESLSTQARQLIQARFSWDAKIGALLHEIQMLARQAHDSP